MHVHLHVTPELAAAFTQAGVTPVASGAATVISAPADLDDWPSTLGALEQLFEAAKAAAAEGSSVVFIISSDALLGRTGALDAMAAVGIVSAARTMALEVRKQGATVNCLATNRQTPLAETTGGRCASSSPAGRPNRGAGSSRRRTDRQGIVVSTAIVTGSQPAGSDDQIALRLAEDFDHLVVVDLSPPWPTPPSNSRARARVIPVQARPHHRRRRGGGGDSRHGRWPRWSTTPASPATPAS
jgi:hypothetical protein